MEVLIISTIPRFAYQVALSMGLAGAGVHVLMDRPWSMVRLSRFCRRYWSTTRDRIESGDERLIRQINNYCQLYGVDIVIPADTRSTRLLCRHGNDFDTMIFPTPDIHLFERLYDKWTFSQYLGEIHVPQPQTQRIQDVSELGNTICFPVIVKPTSSENSEGVVRLDSKESLQQLISEQKIASNKPLLVQEYIPGHDIDMSILADHGEVVAWTIQQRQSDDWTTMTFLNDPDITDLGRKIVQACNYHGVAHIDMRKNPQTGRTCVIEINPRFWGSLEWSVFSGVNFAYLGCLICQGKNPRPLFSPVETACTNLGLSPRQFIKYIKAGRLYPPQFTQPSRVAWKAAHTDPLPHLWNRLAS